MIAKVYAASTNSYLALCFTTLVITTFSLNLLNCTQPLSPSTDNASLTISNQDVRQKELDKKEQQLLLKEKELKQREENLQQQELELKFKLMKQAKMQGQVNHQASGSDNALEYRELKQATTPKAHRWVEEDKIAK